MITVNTISICKQKIHQLLNCKGPTRAEFRYNPKKEEIYFLEINTHPGITPLSIVPEIAMKKGISFENFVRAIIKEALNEK